MQNHVVCYIVLILMSAGISGLKAQPVSMQVSESGDSIFLDMINNIPGPILLDIMLKDPDFNGISFLTDTVVAARDTLYKIVSAPKSVKVDTSFRWRQFVKMSISLGDPAHSKHDDLFLYTLPFLTGRRYSIMQGWGGRFSHRSIESKYAIDFKMPVGDTVCAARGGVVLRAVQNYTKHGGPEFRDKANQVVILHDDGTLGFYVHLDHQGALVSSGDHIQQGEPIGLSGFTGFTTKPHLHFVVREAPNNAVPVYFKGYEGKKLRKKKFYKRREF